MFRTILLTTSYKLEFKNILETKIPNGRARRSCVQHALKSLRYRAECR